MPGTSILVVDPSCFTLSYDYCLCEGLIKAGCKVTLARGEYSYGKWNLRGSFSEWTGFYPYTRKLHARGMRREWTTAVKAAEHAVTMYRFERIVRELQPDIIHFQWLPMPMLDRFCLPKLRKIAPLVLTLHNTTLFHGSPTSRLQGLGFRSVFRHFDAVIVHSEYSRQRVMEKQWTTDEKLHVVPHGTLDYYRTFDKSSVGAGEKCILFFGNIKPYKGVDVLLRAFARLPQQVRSTTRLLIAGRPGQDPGGLQQLAASIDVGHRVTWRLEFIPEVEVAALFRNATVVALPYRDIDQSGVLMTAIAFDKAVVASDIGGISETIRDGVHGRLVQPGDVDGLARGLLDVLVNNSERANMERAVSLLRMGPLSWNTCSSKTIEVYSKIMARHLPS